MVACVLVGMLTLSLKWALTADAAGNYVANDCYGNVLGLSCKSGHRIKVIDDFFGFSPRNPDKEDQCRYRKGDCTVTNGRFTSVIHRYCEGKQTCTNFQVDRRFCGTNQTNYEQVEYQCIPDADVTNLCATASYSAREGYLSTPGFPREYPPDRHCRCSLTSSQPAARIRLEATHFIVKFDNPCKDWLEIAVGKHKRRLCGAYRSTLRSQAFNLTFHSDEQHGHQGIWLHFSLKPEDKNATIKAKCSSIPWPEVTATTMVQTTTTPTQTTTTQIITSTTEFLTSSTTWPTTEEPTSSFPVNLGGNKVHPSTPESDVTSERPTLESFDENEAHRRPPGGNDLLRASMLLPGQPASTTATPSHSTTTQTHVVARPSPSDWLWSSVETAHASTTAMAPPEPPAVTVTTDTVTNPFTAITVTTAAVMEPIYPASLPTTTATTTTVATTQVSKVNVRKIGHGYGSPNDRISEMRKVAESKNAIRRKNNRITGIIIISICVGGIILLIVILSVLLCINKRRQPKRQAEKERKKRLQQRLNSLSFYDSIPLYDSIGRKTGVVIAERTNENETVTTVIQNGGGAKAAGSASTTAPPVVDANGQILDPKRLPWTEPKESDDAEPAGVESDHESTIYSEIGKAGREGEAKTATVPARTLPNGEGPPGYSLHLGVDKNEDIYTHV